MGNAPVNPYNTKDFKIVAKKKNYIVPTKKQINILPKQKNQQHYNNQGKTEEYGIYTRREPVYNDRLEENVMIQRNIQEKQNEYYDPYMILEMRETNDIKLIKKQYKRVALKYHPDKGGDSAKFDEVTKAYVYLVNLLDVKTPSKQMDLLKKENREELPQYESIYFDKKNFSQEKFNKVFNDHRIKNYNDDGYGSEMNNESIDDIKNLINKSKMSGQKFSLELFNSMFSEENTNQEMVVYKEPEELISGNLGFTELDNRKINDFGNHKDIRVSAANSLDFTDYKRAHLNTSIINPKMKIKRKYKNVNELKNERKNISYKMSEEDKRKYEMKKQKQLEDDRNRIQRLRNYDNQWEKQFNVINKVVIKN